MKMMHRRDVVLGAGLVAGLAALRPGAARGAAGGAPAARDVLRAIRLTGEAERTFLARAGRGPCRPEGPAAPRREAAVEADVVVKRHAGGQVLACGLAFRCDARVVNRFTVEGRPLAARRVCFSAAEISWSPGVGWPVYDSYCPSYEAGTAAHYREAKWHQLVPLIGRAYFPGCQSSDVCEAADAGPVGFDVNDSHYDDNAGGYVVTLWSWA